MPPGSIEQPNLEQWPLPASAPHTRAESRGLFLRFPVGQRPSAADVARLVESSRAAGLLAIVSHRPAPEAGWLELLASGLTFDVRGLAPAGSVPIDGMVEHVFGFESPSQQDEYEAVELVPSSHIGAGASLQPVLRTMMAVAANMALNLPVTGIEWRPAGTLMEPRYFARLMLNWLGGGAFPALGLTALVRAQDGSIASRGLAHFTGQEMQLEAKAGESPADAMKLAIRVVDHLIREGRVTQSHTIGSGAQAVLVEPSQVGRLVLVWRGT